ncbi:MAG TPA: hypothetical protein VGO19_04155 [Actinomycetes bacterium]
MRLVVIGLVVFGAVLVVNGATSLFARWVHGADAQVLYYRQQERLAPASLRIGGLLLALGLIGAVVLWLT